MTGGRVTTAHVFIVGRRWEREGLWGWVPHGDLPGVQGILRLHVSGRGSWLDRLIALLTPEGLE